MRSSPIQLSRNSLELVKQGYAPDVIMVSDMLDLPTWAGLVARDQSSLAHRLTNVPCATYFHESQWDYPVSPSARIDHHYGYTNLLNAHASDACWFNSQFHLNSFLDSSQAFLDRMPDSCDHHDLDAIRAKSQVIPPGFNSTNAPDLRRPSNTLRIGWVSRWEHDKRPDRFVHLLDALRRRDVQFQLVLLGQRRGRVAELEEIEQRFADEIIVNQYASSRDEYVRDLSCIDVVVSTADHEFFGIGVCEAIDAGATPLLPDRLSYPELVPTSRRYGSIDEAAKLLETWADSKARHAEAQLARTSIQKFTARHCTAQLDDAIETLATST